ncbi:thioesterase II family protein [Streptomyces sp. S1D4-11]|nr:thioesterase [Streptomyces sp. S1D4-11]QIY99811.1 thioesterase [Streptomyces sp. S1D4-11]
MQKPRDTWLRFLGGDRLPELRLICFPHSGGSATSFAPWARQMRRGTQLLAVQYPGRADRFGAAPAASIQEMGGEVAREMLSEDIPTVLFGQSLGALVAYETAVRMRETGREPELVAVSSSLPPACAGGGDAHLASDDALWAAVRSLGGVEAELAADGELAALVLEVLRDDIALNENYVPSRDGAALSCPVRCYHGIGDPLVDASRLARWADVSTGPFSTHRREGGHFHAFAESHALVDDLLNAP